MNELILTPHNFRKWKLVEDFSVNTSIGIITVPKDFVTNLASTPRFLWAILPPFGKYTEASVVHDYLYFKKELPRKVCDMLFYELMIIKDTYKWKAKTMYWAVRIFGWLPYNRK